MLKEGPCPCAVPRCASVLAGNQEAKQANRVMLYGPDTLGKTHCLAHITHHFYCKGFLIVPSFRSKQRAEASWNVLVTILLSPAYATAANWFYEPLDIQISQANQMDIEQSMDAQLWLHSFMQLNGRFVNDVSTILPRVLGPANPSCWPSDRVAGGRPAPRRIHRPCWHQALQGMFLVPSSSLAWVLPTRAAKSLWCA